LFNYNLFLLNVEFSNLTLVLFGDLGLDVPVKFSRKRSFTSMDSIPWVKNEGRSLFQIGSKSEIESLSTYYA
jgi:hypothetical protein